MMQSSIPGGVQRRFLPSDLRSALAAGLAVASLLAASQVSRAQATAPAPDSAAQTQSAPADSTPDASTPPAPGAPAPSAALSTKGAKTRKQKEDKVVASKDTRKSSKEIKKDNALEGVDDKLPDKELYDKAEDAVKHGHYDVARLDLQTLLNTYPDSQFMMRAKLAIADAWFKEGDTAALTQAEQEYKDFITFFPNAPEAAEAQMRVGDIYFRQMDKPDRDYTNTIKAEEAYRQMLQQFPDSPLVPQAQQRLREVQETMAAREANIAAFYATHANWSAVIARYQTVADTYPLYSQLDDTLIGLGDAYEAEAQSIRLSTLREDAKARLEKINDDQAYAAYSKVVLEHSAAPHVEDARDRIAAMGRPVPTPTAQQVAASAALENSRGQYTLSKRATLFFLHQADTVPAATIGDPPLVDANQTLAPLVLRQTFAEFNAALNPSAAQPQPSSAPAAPVVAAEASAPAPAPSDAPLELQNVPSAASGAGNGSAAAVGSVPTSSSAASSGGSTLGVEIVQPSPNSAAEPATPSSSPPAFPGSTAAVVQAPAAAPANDPPPATVDGIAGVKPVGPPNATPLPPVEKPAAAPDAINEVTPGSKPAAQPATADGKKKPKPPIDKADDSSSKHKPKKGLAKLNPF
jgi:outer membrane protein assembly factor BamD